MKIENVVYDVAVIGGGPSGICSAIAAARLGAKVIITERNGYLGGNGASGLPFLGFLDKHGRKVVGGIAQEIMDRLTEIGGCCGHNRCPLHNSVTVVHADMFKAVAMRMCVEAGVKVLLHAETVDVNTTNGRVTGVSVMGKGMRVNIDAKMFIDATGDGDAAYMAGAEYETGQAETGVMQPPTLMFAIGGFNEEKFFEYLNEHPEDLVPAETMQVSQGYDVEYFRSHKSYVFLGLRSLLARLKAQGANPLKRDTLIYINTPNPGHIYVNTTRVLNFDGTDINELTRGEYEGMEQILMLVKLLREYVPGFESCYISSVNPTLGVRETRRFFGLKRMNIESVIGGEIPEDTIALGSYKVDIHNGRDDSTILTDLEGPYGITLGCLVNRDFKGLLMSGRCISMDAPTLASARVMPTCMAVGEAAGVCAAIACKKGIEASEVAPSEVREILHRNGAILSI